MFPTDAKGIATRGASGKIINAIAPKLSAFSGASAPGKTVLHEYGFTVDNVCLRAKALLS